MVLSTQIYFNNMANIENISQILTRLTGKVDERSLKVYGSGYINYTKKIITP
jgi:hypothetical protein